MLLFYKELRLFMANIQQVAAEAGVSVATVSRYINKPDTVAPKTRVKVKEAIQKLNYEPSSLGRNLRKSESRLFIVLIPSISNPFYFEIIKGIETEALKKQYNIMLCETASDPEREEIYFELVRTRMADGIISMDPAVNIKTLQEMRSEEHTSELQSRGHLVCRLLLEKKNHTELLDEERNTAVHKIVQYIGIDEVRLQELGWG